VQERCLLVSVKIKKKVSMYQLMMTTLCSVWGGGGVRGTYSKERSCAVRVSTAARAWWANNSESILFALFRFETSDPSFEGCGRFDCRSTNAGKRLSNCSFFFFARYKYS